MVSQIEIDYKSKWNFDVKIIKFSNKKILQKSIKIKNEKSFGIFAIGSDHFGHRW
jgi:hypothetical protein